MVTNTEPKESLVVCRNSQSVAICARLLRLTRYLAVFEVYDPNLVLQNSEALSDLRITLFDRTVYSGRAVVSNLVRTGAVLLVEAKLDEAAFTIASLAPAESNGSDPQGFAHFLGQWQKLYKVRPEFKVIVADMQTFLADLRLWLEQVELGIRSTPSGSHSDQERNTAQEFGDAMVPAFDALHERLEELSAHIEEELRPVHQNFAKRQLHPVVMCSPFAYRTYHKPLGYAGDYEMVNMILRDPYEGSSLFAKVMNLWFLSQWPAKAHRNRIQYLKGLLRQESLRGARRGHPIRVLSLGCGPACELQQFLAEDDLCEQTQFTLWDFNEETIQYTSRALNQIKQRYGRGTLFQIQKRSVQHVLKEGAKAPMNSPDKRYDLIYCAGLFDYLPDRTCKQLMSIFYNWLLPGGLAVGTNAHDSKPFRHMLEFVLDWHLLYRDPKATASLRPDQALPETVSLRNDPTGVNLFLEVRKPDHA